MVEDEPQSAEEAEFRAAIEAVLRSPSHKKLVIAGPGTGKTTLFKQLLELALGEPDQRIVLTFINNLKNDLENELDGLAQVFTLHSYCLGQMQREISQDCARRDLRSETGRELHGALPRAGDCPNSGG